MLWQDGQDLQYYKYSKEGVYKDRLLRIPGGILSIRVILKSDFDKINKISTGPVPGSGFQG